MLMIKKISCEEKTLQRGWNKIIFEALSAQDTLILWKQCNFLWRLLGYLLSTGSERFWVKWFIASVKLEACSPWDTWCEWDLRLLSLSFQHISMSPGLVFLFRSRYSPTSLWVEFRKKRGKTNLTSSSPQDRYAFHIQAFTWNLSHLDQVFKWPS